MRITNSYMTDQQVLDLIDETQHQGCTLAAFHIFSQDGLRRASVGIYLKDEHFILICHQDFSESLHFSNGNHTVSCLNKEEAFSVTTTLLIRAGKSIFHLYGEPEFTSELFFDILNKNFTVPRTPTCAPSLN